MAKKTTNSRKNSFLASRSTSGIETSDIGKRCSFNFSYFSPSFGGQDLSDWSESSGSSSLNSLVSKLVNFTKEPLSYWCNERVGAGSLKVLSYYGEFPKGCSFTIPPSVPHDVKWGRFRLGNKVRLAGFSIPSDFKDKTDKDGKKLDLNVFYVVYLDKDHQFYPIEDE
ncbi:TPA: hypothetical protein RQL17_002792 [Vibrio vulnificus]|uniref:hypothetical protein n=1 Tax=Vibrio vulnificus TaxID=672 RepID=UPI0005057D03|nr:hypothetical protein [Vibrio vulnificus]EIV8490589.1 hypothetical protein [Vibrio vulnificus]ELP8107417.1 hypothetical protein [Vibrio vulnificus]ELR8674781.1 hypothetical protein [Vibrio vulnificus]ELR8758769.1 hypothetical protein [Vibrio vulnificus]ELV8700942.1 hypothetical protein [Vibrio vulnificus]